MKPQVGEIKNTWVANTQEFHCHQQIQVPKKKESSPKLYGTKAYVTCEGSRK